MMIKMLAMEAGSCNVREDNNLEIPSDNVPYSALAKKLVAPNSPRLIANEKIPATINPDFIMGNSTFQKMRNLDAPNVEAMLSKSISILLYADKIDLVANGIQIRTWARTIKIQTLLLNTALFLSCRNKPIAKVIDEVPIGRIIASDIIFSINGFL